MRLRCSIIINNFNYSKFLESAIRSALAQTYPHTEVIVVDDGSTDNSRSIIEAWSSQVIPVFKDNGGQGSAFNAGFSACTGDWILFLDSDDELEPEAVSKLMEVAEEHPRAARLQVRMTLVDADGKELGMEEPEGELASGDWVRNVIRLGPSSYPSVPTSASAWSRTLLAKSFPMPELPYRVAADAYLKDIAPLYGSVESLQTPLTRYRIHGSNTSYDHHDPQGLVHRFSRDTMVFEECCRAIEKHGMLLGHHVTAEALIYRRWQHLARRLILWRMNPADHFHPGVMNLITSVAKSGSLWKAPAIYAFLLAVRFVPRAKAAQLVFRLFRKDTIGVDGVQQKPSTLKKEVIHA